MRNKWDERYSDNTYMYGETANDFLRAEAARIPAGGRVLALADGEGRNSVWLAEQGFEVTAVDASQVGMEKAAALAAKRGVPLTTITADLAEFAIQPHSWDGIVSIFCHLPPRLRREVHRHVVAGLKPGGIFLLEGYTPQQLELKTGGPPVVELLMQLAELQQELAGLTLLHGAELVREIHEGKLHNGQGAVVQCIAQAETPEP